VVKEGRQVPLLAIDIFRARAILRVARRLWPFATVIRGGQRYIAGRGHSTSMDGHAQQSASDVTARRVTVIAHAGGRTCQ